MAITPSDFQVFVKPIGPICNLDCHYCYYLDKENLYPKAKRFCMDGTVLEEYIKQHIEASTEQMISFSWHGGEPTLLGLDYFKNIVAIQKIHKSPNQQIINGIQTNGTLLNGEWCKFLAENDFRVGISIDGPAELHDQFRVNKANKSTHKQTVRGYHILKEHQVLTEILCVLNDLNVQYPNKVYRYLKDLGAQYITFLPFVQQPDFASHHSSPASVPAGAFGDFLCIVFEEWQSNDIGQIKIQIFEEAIRTAFGQDHTLCIFKETCGRVPVVEHNGDFYTCDHFVNEDNLVGNIKEFTLSQLLTSKKQLAFGQAKLDSLPQYCITCEVREMCNGGCPKNRFTKTPDGDRGLNYLCAGYKQFFNHCRPFVNEVAKVWRQQNNSR
ncbi:anaerobic sulfatase maturase [Bacteroidota bacterium]